jgi:Flp pilus assembly protein TadG
MIRATTRRPRRRGVTVVEYAIVIGVTLILLLAIFEYGMFVMVRNMVDNAAREGARLATSATNVLTTADIQNRVNAVLSGQRLGTLNTEVYWADASGNNVGLWNNAPFGERIKVQVECTYHPILPTYGFLPNPMTIRGKSIMRSEAN